jgi:hypothetical protein
VLRNDDYAFGYDAQADEYKDLIAAGITSSPATITSVPDHLPNRMRSPARHGAWVHRVRLAERLAKEAFCRLSIALGREQEVDGLAAAVDRPIQVRPAVLHLHVRLIDPPRAIARAQVRPDPLLDLRRVGLDPAIIGRVVHAHAAILQHQLEVAVADRAGLSGSLCETIFGD